MTKNQLLTFFIKHGWTAKITFENYQSVVTLRTHPAIRDEVRIFCEENKPRGMKFSYKPLRFFDYWFLRKDLLDVRIK